MWAELLIYGSIFMVAQNPSGHIGKQDVASQWAYCTHEILNKDTHLMHTESLLRFPHLFAFFHPEQEF